MNKVDEAKFHSPIRSTFEMWVVQPGGRAVGHCHGEELGPFCWPVLATDVGIFSAYHPFAEHTSRM